MFQVVLSPDLLPSRNPSVVHRVWRVAQRAAPCRRRGVIVLDLALPPLLRARRRGPRLRVLGHAIGGCDAVRRRRRRSSRLLPYIASAVPACLLRGCSPHGRPGGGALRPGRKGSVVLTRMESMTAYKNQHGLLRSGQMGPGRYTKHSSNSSQN